MRPFVVPFQQPNSPNREPTSDVADSVSGLEIVDVLFCDVCDSSRLYRELGTTRASSIMTATLDQLSRAVEKNGGRVVDRIGDELLCTFPDAALAAEGAVALQTSSQRIDGSPLPLAVRIGFHEGPVLHRDGRLFGDTVYAAKRVTDRAKPQQVLLTSEAAEALGGAPHPLLRFHETVQLKGQPTPNTLFELVWNQAEATLPIGNSVPPALPTRGSLVVELHGRSRTLSAGDTLTIGRSDQCDFTVNGAVTSRFHARIEGRQDLFVLKDVSTNGTFLRHAAEAEPRHLHREEVPLGDAGLIGLGAIPDPHAPHTLAFRHHAREARA